MGTKWKCETCGSVKLGPTRPRRDNVVRYCLPCSEEKGKLVERVAPTLDAKRAEKSAKAKAREKAFSEREKASERAAYSVGGVDLRDELRAYWSLPNVVEARAIPQQPRPVSQPDLWTKRTGLPGFKLRRSKRKRHTSGHAKVSRGEIVMTLGTPEDLLDARLTLLHEVVHAALPAADWHSSRFWSYYRCAVEEVWPGVWGQDDLKSFPHNETQQVKQGYIYEAVKKFCQGLDSENTAVGTSDP